MNSTSFHQNEFNLIDIKGFSDLKTLKAFNSIMFNEPLLHINNKKSINFEYINDYNARILWIKYNK